MSSIVPLYIDRNKLTILDPREYLCRIASRPGAHNLRCLFRVNFVPIDAYELLRKDSVAFEYLYVQCCNDVTQVSNRILLSYMGKNIYISCNITKAHNISSSIHLLFFRRGLLRS